MLGGFGGGFGGSDTKDLWWNGVNERGRTMWFERENNRGLGFGGIGGLVVRSGGESVAGGKV